MPSILNKTDVQFDDLRVYRRKDDADVVHWYLTVGYDVLTAEGRLSTRTGSGR